MDVDLSLEKKIGKFIRELSISPTMVGYLYLCEAAKMVSKDATLIYEITKGIYMSIAEEHNVSYPSVEASIRRVITEAWKKDKNNIKEKLKLFFISDLDKKPSVSQILAYLNWRIDIEKNYLI